MRERCFFLQDGVSYLLCNRALKALHTLLIELTPEHTNIVQRTPTALRFHPTSLFAVHDDRRVVRPPVAPIPWQPLVQPRLPDAVSVLLRPGA